MSSQNNFTGGELSPRLWSRSDLAPYASGCALARNFVPLTEGPLGRRPTTWLCGSARIASAEIRLVPFRRARNNAYMIEITPGLLRIWTLDGQLVTSNGVPVTVSHDLTDLAGLRWKQTSDAVLFCHRDGRAWRRLLKLSETTWTFGPYSFEDGPWGVENSVEALQLSANNYKGLVSVTATWPAFIAGMEGVRFRVRSNTGLPSIRTWQADWDPSGAELVLSNGRVYYALDSGSTTKTGNTPPSHDQGDASDGQIQWRYLHDNSGELKITQVTSQYTAFAEVIRTLPVIGKDVNGRRQFVESETYAFGPTMAWSEGLYSDYRGWPSAWPELREERLVVGGSRTHPDRYAMSQSAGYYADKATFTPGLGTGTVLDDDAITGYVGDDGFQASWFASASMLVCGAFGGESVIVGQTGEAALTPAEAKPRALSAFGGTADLPPVKAGSAILWASADRSVLRDLVVSAYDYPGQSSDLSLMARHIADRRYAAMAFCAAPNYQLWTRQADSSLACLTYHTEQNIRAWTQQALGGGWVVEDLASLPDPLGTDRIWLAVKKTLLGVPQRLLIRMADPRHPLRLDCAVSASGTGLTGLTGLGALNGETVNVYVTQTPGRGYVLGAAGVVVTNGAVSLPQGQSGAEIVAGVPCPARFESLPLLPIERHGQRLKPARVYARFQGVSCRAGAGDRPDLDAPEMFDAVDDRAFDSLYSLNPEYRTAEFAVPADTRNEPRIVIETTDDFDFVLGGYRVTYG